VVKKKEGHTTVLENLGDETPEMRREVLELIRTHHATTPKGFEDWEKLQRDL
jgi:hypothetical protein